LFRRKSTATEENQGVPEEVAASAQYALRWGKPVDSIENS
jgi:hypothetical protein